MNPKKVNWLFLTTLLVEAAVMAFMYLCSDISLGIIESLLLSQLIVLVPAVLFLFGTRTDPGRLIAHNRPKFTTTLLVVKNLCSGASSIMAIRQAKGLSVPCCYRRFYLDLPT